MVRTSRMSVRLLQEGDVILLEHDMKTVARIARSVKCLNVTFADGSSGMFEDAAEVKLLYISNVFSKAS